MYLILNTCVHSSDVNPGQYIYHQYVYTVRIQTCIYLYASIFIIHIYASIHVVSTQVGMYIISMCI